MKKYLYKISRNFDTRFQKFVEIREYFEKFIAGPLKQILRKILNIFKKNHDEYNRKR